MDCYNYLDDDAGYILRAVLQKRSLNLEIQRSYKKRKLRKNNRINLRKNIDKYRVGGEYRIALDNRREETKRLYENGLMTEKEYVNEMLRREKNILYQRMYKRQKSIKNKNDVKLLELKQALKDLKNCPGEYIQNYRKQYKEYARANSTTA